MPKRTIASPPVWATLTDAETGQLPRAPSDEIVVPAQVEVEDDRLCFVWTFPKFLKLKPTLLESFLRLRSNDQFLRFARRWGPLAPRGLYGVGVEHGYGPQTPQANSGLHTEDLANWRAFQAQLRNVLVLAACVREDQSPSKQTFEELHAIRLLPAVDGFTRLTDRDLPLILNDWDRSSKTSRLQTGRAVFLGAIQGFVRHCRLKPALSSEWRSGHWRLNLVFQDARADFAGSGLSLFGALTVQAMSAATGSTLAVCSACGNFFVPRRRQPAFGRRRYCHACGRGAAMRDAKRAYRSRLRAVKAGQRMTH